MDDSTIFQTSGSKGKQQQAYTKIKVLGEGAMGKAYLVQSNSDHELYVMKRINIGHLNTQQKQSAMRQAHLHSIVKHTNIIAFKQIYHTTKDKLCIIMEYAQNGDLEQFLQQKNGKLLAQQIVLNYFVQICLGLKQIHSKKIIHRDIKAANIFLTKDMIVKIGDFGISKVIDQTVQATKSFVGTPYYLSPEMVEGKPYSSKADIWALGVLLYNMCCQKLPFEANSLPLLALRILRGNYPPVVAPYSKDLKSLIISMLQVDQKKRPSVTDILNKQFLQKYIPKQELEQLQEKNRLKGVKSPISSISSTSVVTNNANLSIKGLKKQNKEKGKVNQEEKRIQEKELKEAKKKRRDEQIKEMREDMRRKKLEFQSQKQKVGGGSTKNTQPYESQKSRVSVKKTLETDKSPQKNKPGEQANTKQPSEKPWKIAKQKGIKKQVEVEILLPSIKPRESKKQVEADLSIDYKIEIKEYGKRPIVPNVPQSISPENQDEQQIKQGSDNQTQELQSSHSDNQNQESSDEDIGMQTDFQQMMNHLNHAQQVVQGLKNPTRHIQLYEQSSNFEESQIATERRPENQMSQINEIAWSAIHKSDNLEQCRLILEESLGYQKFIQSYNILKDHLQYSQQKKMRGEDLDKYTFNKEILFQKLNFMTEKEFSDCIMLLYTVIIIEQEEMKKNTFT